jgi:hypothetical protein
VTRAGTVTRREGGAPVRPTLAVAMLLLLGGGGAARAEPLELDERQLGAVAAGTAAGVLGPVNIAIGISNPTEVVVSPSTEVAADADVGVANQVGTGVAVNATTALGVLADGVAAAGFSEVGASLGLP